MNDHAPEQLDKILALADSDHEGEAVVAVRKARQMLERDGLSFADLARAAATNTLVKSSGVLSLLTGGREYLQSQIHHLRLQVEDLKSQLITQELQIDVWRRRVSDLEQSQQHALSEAERWRKLASETADRLWDMGRSIGGEEFLKSEPSAEALPPVKKKKHA